MHFRLSKCILRRLSLVYRALFTLSRADNLCMHQCTVGSTLSIGRRYVVTSTTPVGILCASFESSGA